MLLLLLVIKYCFSSGWQGVAVFRRLRLPRAAAHHGRGQGRGRRRRHRHRRRRRQQQQQRQQQRRRPTEGAQAVGPDQGHLRPESRQNARRSPISSKTDPGPDAAQRLDEGAGEEAEQASSHAGLVGEGVQQEEEGVPGESF